MKTQLKMIAPIALFMFSLTTFSCDDATDVYLEFSLVAKSGTGYLDQCTVTLMQNNQVVDTLKKPNLNRRFVFILKENTCYTIIVSCKGYHNRKVSINTCNPAGLKPGMVYHLDARVQMIPVKKKIDENYSDHPVAIVEYVPGRDVFDIRKRYTRNYKKIVQQ